MLVQNQKPASLKALSCRVLQGVGARVAEKLARLHIQTVQDLLFHLPSRYQDRTHIYSIEQLNPGDHVVVEGVIDHVSMPKGGRTRLFCHLRDESGRLGLRFFYVNAFQRQALQLGVAIRCFGEVRRGASGLEMIHPEYHLLNTNDEKLTDTNSLTPIYPATEGLSQLTLRKLTEQALELLNKGGVLEDILPKELLSPFTFSGLKEALQFVHRPPAGAHVAELLEGKHPSQKRLVFEELLAHRLSLLHLKKAFQKQQAFPMQPPAELTKKFLLRLPFQLTHAQHKVANQINQDLAASCPMLRLVQGDVGSGKTVVAALAVLQAIENGYQCVVLAPTELLVEQHYRTFSAWLEPLNIPVAMLSGHTKTVKRREITDAIAAGKPQLIVGTHALFQKDVNFTNLALVIVDEQHRFGVQQRSLLREKGVQHHYAPHQLIMTATPIPRTLAMSVYADLDYSVIDELPPGRTPVSTRVVASSRRNEVLNRIREACLMGRQAYWVCTLIEESDVLQCQAAENTWQEMQHNFPELKIGLVHGRLKPQEKEQVMSAFKAGELHLLVATTVIEVGVDVPNASLMVVENAERLGLAQLHQLRGRVGRGAIESHCVLIYQHPLSQLAKQRLAVMRETTDGFMVAERDLQLRGPGEVLGTRQTGEISLKVADLVRDSDLLPAVSEAAAKLIQQYPDCVPLMIERWLGNSIKYGNV